MTTFLVVLLILVVVPAVWAVTAYNGLVVARNRFRNAYSQIDVQLKRRYELIPNLVEAVKGYLAHERQTLEAVTTARNSAVSANQKAAGDPTNQPAMTQMRAAEAGLSGALGRLFALAEAYPDLKANQNMTALQEELASTENKIAFARQAYNDAVMEYNISVDTFPNSIVAGACGFRGAQQWEVESPEERKAVKVSFS